LAAVSTIMAAALKFTSSAFARPRARLEGLRQTLGATPRSVPYSAASGGRLIGPGEAVLALGIPAIDAALGGGLGGGALHEIAAVREAAVIAATGFALALAARVSREARTRCTRQQPTASQPAGNGVFWIAEDLSLAENGVPYGPALDQAGIAPEQLITVVTTRGRDALWAMEEALRCQAVGMVIGELRARSIDHVATRRLSLAAAAGNTLGLILRIAPDHAPSAAATRWIIGPAPSSIISRNRSGIGPPRLSVQLVRNRRGHYGAWIVEWNSVEQRFELAAHSERVAGATFDRPHRAAVG
jgi:protein ImuA